LILFYQLALTGLYSGLLDQNIDQQNQKKFVPLAIIFLKAILIFSFFFASESVRKMSLVSNTPYILAAANLKFENDS